MADPLSLVLTPIVERIIDSSASLIKEEFLLLRGVKKDVENLKTDLTAIKAVLQDAENKQSNSSSLKDWLGKLQNAAYDAEDILDMFQTEAFLWKQKQKERKIRPPLSVSQISLQRTTAHKIEEISARIKTIANERKIFNLDTTDTVVERSQIHPNTSFVVDTKDVFGRESDKDKIINLLLSDEFDKDGEITVIPIIGMGGLGKTTLAQLIFNDQRVVDHFELGRMWVCVTVDFNLTKVLVDIMESYSKMKATSNLSDNQIIPNFVQFLRGKKYLLVLDDVWIEDYSQWELLRQYLNHGKNGSKVIVTSRTENVSRIMGTQPPHRLGFLPEDQCWSLFQKIAFTDDNLSSGQRKKLEDIGNEIVGKCKGLPLAVKAMGGLLRGNVDENRWLRILRSPIWELEGGNPSSYKPNILPALKLSYDYLPPYLRQCFLYCSIFPKSYAFNRTELVKLWMAQKFIQTTGQERKEGIGHEYFNELLVRSFFQVQFSVLDQEDRYYMHDLVHDLAQSIASGGLHYCLVKDEKSCCSSKDSRHVSLLCEDIEQPAMNIIQDSKKLRTLVFPSEYSKDFGRALKMIFHELRLLRVLDLSSSMIMELPDTIENLKLLCFLDLSRTKIKSLPNSICSLYNLQTLKLLRCPWLIELPKDLRKLVNLRHLELDDIFWFKLSTLPRGIGKLTSLHNLHAFQVGHENGYGIEELKDMANLTGRLHISRLENAVNSGDCKLSEKENLQKLVVEWSDGDVNNPQDETVDVQVLEGLQPHSNLKELQICHYQGARFPTWMTDGVLRNLVTVSLAHCTKCKILSFSQLPCLKNLLIKGMQELEKWQDVECTSLIYLKITNCPKLSELPKSIFHVRVLKIKKCDSLKSLPISLSLNFVELVDNLLLAGWNEQPVRLIHRNDRGQLQVHFRSSLIDLLGAKIINCPKLQALPEVFFPQELEISGCKLLNTLPDPQFSQRLMRLALDEFHDGTLVKAIPNTSSLYSLVISNISNLASFPKWPHLPVLKALYINACRELVSLSEEEEGSFVSLTSLKLLSIRGCPKLVKLPDEGLPSALEFLSIGSCANVESFGSKGTLASLVSLKDFYIEDCPKIHSFPEDGLPDSLQHLHIQKCPKLTKRCQTVNGEDCEWPKIKTIPDLEINSVKESSAEGLPKKKESSGWYQPIVCRGGLKFKGKMEPAESSALAQNSSTKSVNFKAKEAAVATKNSQVFLEHKTKKTWIDEKSGHNCFMLYPMSLSITWGSHREYWSWDCFKETTDENIEVAKLSAVCWLDVRGKLKMSELSAGVVYEIVYVVKLTNEASGWELPVVLRLSLPDGKVRERQVSLFEKARGEWLELSLGNFLNKNGETGEVCFDLVEHGGHWKNGLIIKGVILRPRNS